MEGVLQELYMSVLDGQRQITQEKVVEALESHERPGDVLEAMVTAMGEVGRLFEEGDYYVPEMLISAHAMKVGMVILKPVLVNADIQPVGKIIAGTVKGDLHDIGKNLLCMMLEGAGFQLVDLGTDVSPEDFVVAVYDHEPDFIAMSALLTTTMPNMKKTIEALKVAGIRHSVKVIIGGAPITDSYAMDIGADGYAADASRAVKLVNSLVHHSQLDLDE